MAPDVGVPLLRVNLKETKARLEALSAVEQASVKRDWPTGLAVNLIPRRAAAAVLDGDSYVLLDASATQVVRIDAPPPGLPIIQVPLTKDNQRTVKAVLVVAASLPEWLASQVATIGAETPDTVSFTLTNGVVVIWGDSEQAAVKAAAIQLLLKQPTVASIDVSAPESPVLR
jgi:cell division protein FtsQ